MSSADFSRQVWCILGVPVDRMTLTELEHELRHAASREGQFFLSTPNLNYVATAWRDKEFRESLIESDLSVADGMPLIWVARLLGYPFRERVAGSDLTQHMLNQNVDRPIRIFFFGGEPGAAERACEIINARQGGFHAIGNVNPGYGTIEDMSQTRYIDAINASRPDLLSVSVGAHKGQLWLYRNRARLRARIVSHLGAVVNFFAGTVRRAPVWMQRLGLEWLWRIIQEPTLWQRYLLDGALCLRLCLTRILPYVLWLHWFEPRQENAKARCEIVQQGETVRIKLAGVCVAETVSDIVPVFEQAAKLKQPCVLDFEEVTLLDGRFIGLLLVLRKQLGEGNMNFVGVKPMLKRLFRWNCADYLLSPVHT